MSSKQKNKNILNERRKFIQKMSLLFGAMGISNTLSLELKDKLALKVYNTAEAADVPLKRMIFIGVRAGVSLLGFGVNSKFKALANATFPNAPFVGNQFISTDNTLMLTPSSQSLAPYASNIAITQGVVAEGGHSALFNFWEGGFNKKLTSPLISLCDRNTTASPIAGVQFYQNDAAAIEHVTNGKPALLNRSLNDFKSTFKKPSLALNDSEVKAVLDLSEKLSRRQALNLKNLVRSPDLVVDEKSKATNLLLTDFSSKLIISDMSAQLTKSTDQFQNFAERMSYSLKAMSLNLINSVSLVLETGDWHGMNTTSSTLEYFQEVSKILAATVEYLKKTPDPASSTGQKLWDTTTIVMGSEFTRADRGFGQDNGDGGSQGVMLIGSNVRGGFWGDCKINTGSDPTISFMGIDVKSGTSLSGEGTAALNTPEQIYQTISYLAGNSVNSSLVLKKMVI